MTSEHTKAFRVRRAVKELIIAEADLMEIRLYSDDKKKFKEEDDRLRVIESEIMDFTHAQLHQLHDTLQGYLTEESDLIPIGKSTYVVMKDGKALRSANVLGAREAHAQLKLKAGEQLFIEVGSE